MNGRRSDKTSLITFWDHLRHGFGSGCDVTSQFCRDFYNQTLFFPVNPYRHVYGAHDCSGILRGLEFFCSLPIRWFHHQNSPSEVKLVISKEEKTFTDNICDELRKRSLSLKINPGAIRFPCGSTMVYDFYLYANSSFELGHKIFDVRLISRSIVLFTSHPKNGGEEDAQFRTTNVCKSWCHWKESRDAFTRRFTFENCCTWTTRSWSHWFIICVHARRSFELSREKKPANN